MRSSGAHCSVVLSLLSASLLAVFGFSSSVEAQAPAGASADLGTVEGAAKLAASAGAAPADVLGIKLGIQAKDVLPLVKAANAKYQIKQNYACQSGSGCDKSSSPPVSIIGTDNNGDTLQVGFTLPPTPAYVFGVNRYVEFPEGARPTLQTVLDSLHKKYGDHTADRDTVFPGIGKPLDSGPTRYVAVWIFDAQGHLFKFAKDAKLACRLGDVPTIAPQDMSLGMFSGGRPQVSPATPCNQTTVVANLTVMLNGLVMNMNVSLNDQPLYESSNVATWTMFAQQAKQQQEQKLKQAAGITAPKL